MSSTGALIPSSSNTFWSRARVSGWDGHSTQYRSWIFTFLSYVVCRKIFPMRLSRRTFEALVLDALEGIPELIRTRMQNVDVVIEDWPEHDQLTELGMEPDELLFGLYEGTPLTER